MECRVCGKQVSLTDDTLLHRTRLTLPDWFSAAWMVATTNGLSSVKMARQLGINQKGAYALLARLRQAMARSLTNSLSNVVEADEAFFGRKEHQLVVEVLAEARDNGRVRMATVSGQNAAILIPFIMNRVEAGTTIRTDGWKSYNGLAAAGLTHERIVHLPGWIERGERSTPYADEAISATKHWLLATYNKPPTPENLDAYLAEFCFRREYRYPGAAFEALLRGLVTPR